MHDPVDHDRSAPQPEDPSTESSPGQADELDRGTGRGASGGGLGGSTGFWSDGPAKRDLEKAGVDPDFERALERPKAPGPPDATN